MEAVPTLYQGRQYRSRLEARWAAMFDLLQWRVEYEPIDFEGWIPDFVISEAKEVFVEVKPVSTFPAQAAEKIRKSGCCQEVLIVGYSVPIEDQYLGWLRHAGEEEDTWEWGEAALGVWKGTESASRRGRINIGNQENLIGFCHATGSFHDRITGFYDGGSYGSGHDTDVLATIRSYWQEAGNLVQWRRPHR
ncbi:hypothetical protein [Phormidium sp. FACHB-1136]|uniref:hypothetical protein n=1 Tax=Phormidium sp. FACHB-1136 TaxID=2692848 RepID=UPI0016880FC5|nr:hypothetical protein [Phormidium sp. FACHB-1136]MBD2425967.1 hypothetical protein [Phormidium sp. FACHB-1136]